MAIFVNQGEAKSQFLKILKSLNLAQLLRSQPEFLHMITICMRFQILYCNLGSHIPQSLISDMERHKLHVLHRAPFCSPLPFFNGR